MAVTELPVDYPHSVAGGSFVLGNHALRSNWCDSFYLPADPQVSYVLYGGSGAVQGSGSQIIAFNVGSSGIFGGSFGESQPIQTPGSLFTLTGFVAVCINGNAPSVFSVTSLSPTFPAGSLPIAVLGIDGVGRVQQTIDCEAIEPVECP